MHELVLCLAAELFEFNNEVGGERDDVLLALFCLICGGWDGGMIDEQFTFTCDKIFQVEGVRKGITYFFEEAICQICFISAKCRIHGWKRMTYASC